MYDRRCESCGNETLDHWEPITFESEKCHACGGNLARVWLMGRANSVTPDGIPGGVWIKNGLCNDDGTPRRYDSHTEIRREAARRGLQSHVEHIGSQGSDKNKHTSRWI